MVCIVHWIHNKFPRRWLAESCVLLSVRRKSVKNQNVLTGKAANAIVVGIENNFGVFRFLILFLFYFALTY